MGEPMISRPRTDNGRTVVIALGGNALQPPGEQGDIHQQFAHTRESLGAIVALAGAGWRIAIVHGNGPQIGDELLRNELARERRPPLPLGVLVAATAGWIGYMIQQSLQNALAVRRIERSVVTLVTQALVDRDDPALKDAAKPIGNTMDEATARRLSAEMGFRVAQVDGGWRRLVPSPRPIALVEADEVAQLVSAGTIVITAGGGGTPVYRDPVLGLEGVDAVVDKDHAAAVLARSVDAELLLILTNVDGVFHDFADPASRELIRVLRAEEAEKLLEAGEFGAGSMGPKVEAAISFVRSGGKRACIARLDHGLDAVGGNAGTSIVS